VFNRNLPSIGKINCLSRRKTKSYLNLEISNGEGKHGIDVNKIKLSLNILVLYGNIMIIMTTKNWGSSKWGKYK